eukprot:767614-Hanusia_phi.AAC.9
MEGVANIGLFLSGARQSQFVSRQEVVEQGEARKDFQFWLAGIRSSGSPFYSLIAFPSDWPSRKREFVAAQVPELWTIRAIPTTSNAAVTGGGGRKTKSYKKDEDRLVEEATLDIVK